MTARSSTRRARSAARPRAGRPGARAIRGRRARSCARWRSRRGGPLPCPPARSVAPVPLLAPRVPVVVVAQALPEPRGVMVGQVDALKPFRGLPEIQMRNEQAGRAAVLRLEWLAVEVEGHPR